MNQIVTNLTLAIQDGVKSKKIIIGERETIRFIKVNSPKLIVTAKNISDQMRKEIEHNAKISNLKVEVFDGNSKELGMICGKQFPVSALVIKS
jgi:large subunit ribosomal protein L30e